MSVRVPWRVPKNDSREYGQNLHGVSVGSKLFLHIITGRDVSKG
jgi:hypothetical protein